MRVGSPSAFAEAREEIQLWPAAAVGYYLTHHYTHYVIGLFVITLFTGAITYKVHSELRNILKKEKRLNEVRQRVSRDGQSNSSDFRMFIRTLQGLWDAISPNNRAFQGIVWGGMAVNLIVGLYLFRWMGGQVVGQTSPTVTTIGLFSLPLLMLATIIASLILSG